MKFHIENLGWLNEATIDLSDLTIICGENNTGKTSVIHSIYGFFRNWRSLLRALIIEDFEQGVYQKGDYRWDLDKMFSGKINDYLMRMGHQYTRILPKVLGSHEGAFNKSQFIPSVTELPISKNAFQTNIRSASSRILASLTKERGSSILEFQIVSSTQHQFDVFMLMCDVATEIVFASYFPVAHVSTAERTGAIIFRNEFEQGRAGLLGSVHELSIAPSERVSGSRFLLENKTSFMGHSLPVEDNLSFMRQLEDFDKQLSDLSKQHPDILSDFDNVTGGYYKIRASMGVVFENNNGSQCFTMNESSGGLRALLDIGFYLYCIAKPGDLLIIDTPELNLHPRNQRALARLLSKLVHYKIKVLLTTHSDYLIKEFNTLIMLNQRTIHTKKVQSEYNYDENELLDPNDVCLYITGTDLKYAEGENQNIKTINTLKLGEIYSDRGMAVTTFDETIDIMNTIQEDILLEEEN
jgi:AAA15 family ATPase/GTPase